MRRITSIRGFSCEKIGGDSETCFRPAINDTRFSIYKIFGKPGRRGGNEGNGGRGGKGGNQGVVNLYELGTKSGISKRFEGGRCGGDGRGGERGQGGYGGNHIIVRCNRDFPCSEYYYYTLANTTYKFVPKESISNSSHGEAGRKGDAGANKKGLQNPEPASIISEPFKILNS